MSIKGLWYADNNVLEYIDDMIEEIKQKGSTIHFWWHQRPSGKRIGLNSKQTINKLKEKIEKDKFFFIYAISNKKCIAEFKVVEFHELKDPYKDKLPEKWKEIAWGDMWFDLVKRKDYLDKQMKGEDSKKTSKPKILFKITKVSKVKKNVYIENYPEAQMIAFEDESKIFGEKFDINKFNREFSEEYKNKINNLKNSFGLFLEKKEELKNIFEKRKYDELNDKEKENINEFIRLLWGNNDFAEFKGSNSTFFNENIENFFIATKELYILNDDNLNTIFENLTKIFENDGRKINYRAFCLRAIYIFLEFKYPAIFTKYNINKINENVPNIFNKEILEMIKGRDSFYDFPELLLKELKECIPENIKKYKYQSYLYFNILFNELKKMTSNNEAIDQVKEMNIFVKKGDGMNYSLNTIFYGPPGTGKTYSTLDRALNIIHEDEKYSENLSRDDLQKEFKNLLDEGRIRFVTFHQSFGYEEFVEGIKPSTENGKIKYEIEDGVFKSMCIEGKFSIYKLLSENKEKEINFNELYDSFITQIKFNLQSKQVKYSLKTGGNILIKGINKNNNIVFSHEESEKEYIVSKKRMEKLYNNYSSISDFDKVSDIRNCIGGCNATGYWAIFNKLKKHENGKFKSELKIPLTDDLDYQEKKKLVSDFSFQNINKISEKPENFVLIIDEINRGNVARIFGELITLIEEDKRSAAINELSVTLPYSQSSFSVPPNLYIIGTMNTADRSVEALDTALRRRFSFEEFMPDDSLLEKEPIDGIDLKQLLMTINKRIELLYDRDHTIGHSYLLNVKNLQELKMVFKDKIIPLIQEYFYSDWNKIMLIIGDGFVAETKKDKMWFMNDDSGNTLDEFSEKGMYELIDWKEWKKENFISIYEKQQKS